jgi:hypothetical protein
LYTDKKAHTKTQRHKDTQINISTKIETEKGEKGHRQRRERKETQAEQGDKGRATLPLNTPRKASISLEVWSSMGALVLSRETSAAAASMRRSVSSMSPMSSVAMMIGR